MNAKKTPTNLYDLTESVNVDYKRRLYSFLAFHYIGIIFLASFSVLNASLVDNQVASLTTLLTVALSINLITYYRYKALLQCSRFTSFCIIAFCIVLVFHGGVENTALFWVYPFPIILFVLLGRLFGFIANAILYVTVCMMFLFPEYIYAEYGDVEKVRFLATLFLLNFFSFINEYHRENSHITMTNINVSKEQKANTDALTLLPNRRFVDSIFFPATKLDDFEAFPMVMIMADVDHFKKLNDTYGHKVGDIALEKLSRVLENSVRTDDVVARVGGEEFLLLFSNTDYDTGMLIANKIKKNIENMVINIDEAPLNITMSFGLAVSEQYTDIDDTIKLADDKLYEAKRNGRNRIC